MSNTICFILDWYPTETNHGCVFAKHLICAIADQGYECVVIAPRIICKDAFRKENKVPYHRIEMTEDKSKIHVYTPFYLHLSSQKYMMKFSMNHHYWAVMRTIWRHHIHPSVVYGHFIYQCGLTAARVGEKLGIPSYCACGESSLRLGKGKKPYETGLVNCRWADILSKLSGIVCVSGNNKRLLIENGFVTEATRIKVFPNGVDVRKFYPMDKKKCRQQLGFPEDVFIVAYTGAFTVNKGADRLNKALKDCKDTYSIFLGQGPEIPDCDGILFSGRVPNSDVAVYLNAADVFVLPTKGEGCCNAIVEALACGLPVISSDLPFNDDILNEKNSLRIDVEDIKQIKDSINRLKNDIDFRIQLANGAREAGYQLDINKRSCKILEFMRFTK